MRNPSETEIISPTRLQRDFEQIARSAGGGKRFVIRSKGAAVAIISTKLLDRLMEDEDDRAVIQSRRHEKLIPWSRAKVRLGF